MRSRPNLKKKAVAIEHSPGISQLRPQDMDVIKPPSSPNSRYLVFTSAGDAANLQHWLRGRRDFDLWIVYYGERSDTNEAHANFYARSAGTKFQNLHRVYQRYAGLIAQY